MESSELIIRITNQFIRRVAIKTGGNRTIFNVQSTRTKYSVRDLEMEMRERIKTLIKVKANPRTPWVHMEQLTGIRASTWQNFDRGRQRANDEMLAALGRVWPQYAFWLMTAKTDPEHGHLSPEDKGGLF